MGKETKLIKWVQNICFDGLSGVFSCQSEAKFINRSKSSSKWYSKVLKYHVEKWWLEWGLLANSVPHVLAETGIGERRPRLRQWQRLHEKEQERENSSSNNDDHDDDDDDHNIHISSEIYVFASRFLYNECNPHLPHPLPVIKKQLHSLLLGGNFSPPPFLPGFLDLDFQQAFDEIFTSSRIEDLIQPEPQGGSVVQRSKGGEIFVGWTFAQAGWCFFVSFKRFCLEMMAATKKHNKKMGGTTPWDLQDLAISLDISWGVGLNTVEETQHWFAMARNLKNNGITYQPQLVTWPDFWLPSTVGNSGSGESSCHFLLEISKGTWWLLGVF